MHRPLCRRSTASRVGTFCSVLRHGCPSLTTAHLTALLSPALSVAIDRRRTRMMSDEGARRVSANASSRIAFDAIASASMAAYSK